MIELPISPLELDRKLMGCVSERFSLADFRDWFVPRSLNVEISNDQSVIDAVYRIDGILSEASAANWKDEEVRDELRRQMRDK